MPIPIDLWHGVHCARGFIELVCSNGRVANVCGNLAAGTGYVYSTLATDFRLRAIDMPCVCCVVDGAGKRATSLSGVGRARLP